MNDIEMTELEIIEHMYADKNNKFFDYLSFKTKIEAEYFLHDNGLEEDTNGAFYRPGTYILNHGENDRPEYRIRKYKDSYYIKKYFFYIPGDLFAPKDYIL